MSKNAERIWKKKSSNSKPLQAKHYRSSEGIVEMKNSITKQIARSVNNDNDDSGDDHDDNDSIDNDMDDHEDTNSMRAAPSMVARSTLISVKLPQLQHQHQEKLQQQKEREHSSMKISNVESCDDYIIVSQPRVTQNRSSDISNRSSISRSNNTNKSIWSRVVVEDSKKLYCHCRRPSFDKMIACDNPKVMKLLAACMHI
jgi:hypothetical protein